MMTQTLHQVAEPRETILAKLKPTACTFCLIQCTSVRL